MLLFYLSLIDDSKNKTKFELLYNEYRSTMMHIACAILNNETAAEDAVHEAFIHLADSMDKIETINSDKTKMFVTVIVKNTALNMKSKEKYCISVSHEDMKNIESNYPNVFDSVVVKCMLDKITKLPEIYRDILQLKMYYDMSNKEVAKQLHITESTVRKRLQRLRQYLK